MFCMNCGQQLPGGAKFCWNCGTPIGAVSPIKSTQSRTVNNDRSQITETDTESLLKRVEIMLKDGDFGGAMSKCLKILDSDPTNGNVYFYMLMSNMKCRDRKDLILQKAPFDCNPYYLKAMQYGDLELKNELTRDIKLIHAKTDKKQKNPEVGDEIYFGTNNGLRILWKVLSVRDRTVLIISSNNIINKPYHEPGGFITWAECSLKRWLNIYFINSYFSPEERARIIPCKLNNDNNPEYNTPGGVTTTNKVFLLSINEVNRLLTNKLARANGSSWWLRSPGGGPSEAAVVHSDGIVYTWGYDVREDIIGVRPALWIKLDP